MELYLDHYSIIKNDFVPAIEKYNFFCIHLIFSCKKATTAEPAYSYIVYNRYSAIVVLNLVPFAFISLLFYPCYNRLLL